MRAFYRTIARLRGLFRRNERDEELEREMHAHLEMVIDEYIRRGMNPDEARRQALIESGGIEQAKEAVRDQRTMPRVEAIVRDFSFAWRRLRRSPAYAIPVIVSLALGIGLNTSIFTMMQDVLRRPLPYPNEAELITVGKLYAARNDYDRPSADWLMFEPDLTAWQSGSRTLSMIGAFNSAITQINARRGPEYVEGGTATANLLTVLGAQTLHGRWFTDTEVRDRVVVLSYALWNAQFAQDPAVVGQTMTIQGNTWTIIGVLPRNIGLPLNAQYWTPCNHCTYAGQVVARPKPGVALPTIAMDLEALSPSVKNTRNAGTTLELVVMSLHEQLFGSMRPALQLLTGAAALLFLIACANIANLSLARTLERRRELAVRAALGAGRQSLALLVLAENSLLAMFGAVAGLAIAYASSGILTSLAPAEMLNVRDVQVNAGSAVFAFTLAIAAAALVSVAPILNVTNGRTRSLSAQSNVGAARGRSANRVRYGLVTTQLALTLLLMTGAGLLIRSVTALARPDRLGFSPGGVVVAYVRLNRDHYPDSIAHRTFTERLTEKLSALPGVQHVAIGPAPLIGRKGFLGEGVGVFSYADPLQPGPPRHNIWVKDVGVDYLSTFRIGLKSGRNFTRTDDANATRVALVNSAAARVLFADRNPIGLPIPTKFYSDSNHAAPVVVGVVEDVLQRDLTLPSNPEVLFPAAQRGFSSMVTLAIRTTAPANATISAARAAIREIDPSVATLRLESMQSIFNASLSTHTFLLRLLVLFAALALILSVIGLYAIVSYLVSQRRVEIGVRIALGAQRVQIFGIVVGEGALLVLAGVTIGSIAAFAFSRLLGKFLYEVQPHDTMTFVLGPLVLAVVALLAAYVPALRATRVDPVITLRAD